MFVWATAQSEQLWQISGADCGAAATLCAVAVVFAVVLWTSSAKELIVSKQLIAKLSLSLVKTFPSTCTCWFSLTISDDSSIHTYIFISPYRLHNSIIQSQETIQITKHTTEIHIFADTDILFAETNPQFLIFFLCVFYLFILISLLLSLPRSYWDILS